MFQGRYFQIAALIFILAAFLCLLTFDTPVDPAPAIILSVVSILYAAWHVIRILQGRDEVISASIRFALAFGGGLGVPAALVFVMIMRASPDVAAFITRIAAISTNELSPAAVGFGLGVGFTVVVASFFFVIGNSVWWFARR